MEMYLVSYLQYCGKCLSGCDEWELIFMERTKYIPECIVGGTITFESFKKEMVTLKITNIITNEQSKEILIQGEVINERIS